MLAELFAVLAPVLFTAALGYGWVRGGLQFSTDFVARLVLNIATPCLILSTLSKADLSAHAFAEIALGCVVVTLTMGLLAWLLCRVAKVEWRVLVPGFLFPNTGNMGLPMALYAFGEHGLAYAVAFFVVLSMAHFTFGQALSGGRPTLRECLRNPILISLALAVPLLVWNLELPRWLENSLELLAGLAIPLMLMTLGVSLASIRAHHLGSGLLMGCLRVMIGSAVGWLVATLLQLDPLARNVLILQSSMPVAVFNYLFAMRAGRSPEAVASLVLCSTVFSFAYLPLLLYWLL